MFLFFYLLKHFIYNFIFQSQYLSSNLSGVVSIKKNKRVIELSEWQEQETIAGEQQNE